MQISLRVLRRKLPCEAAHLPSGLEYCDVYYPGAACSEYQSVGSTDRWLIRKAREEYVRRTGHPPGHERH